MLRSVSAAPSMAPPEESLTAPPIAPKVDCACKAGMLTTTAAITNVALTMGLLRPRALDRRLHAPDCQVERDAGMSGGFSRRDLGVQQCSHPNRSCRNRTC